MVWFLQVLEPILECVLVRVTHCASHVLPYMHAKSETFGDREADDGIPGIHSLGASLTL